MRKWPAPYALWYVPTSAWVNTRRRQRGRAPCQYSGRLYLSDRQSPPAASPQPTLSRHSLSRRRHGPKKKTAPLARLTGQGAVVAKEEQDRLLGRKYPFVERDSQLRQRFILNLADALFGDAEDLGHLP